MINIAAEDLATLRAVLSAHLSAGEVRAFGSRVSGAVKPYSDLDLMLKLPTRIDLQTMGRLREALQESTLPFRVDLVDWHSSSDEFREIMEAGSERVWP